MYMTSLPLSGWLVVCLFCGRAINEFGSPQRRDQCSTFSPETGYSRWLSSSQSSEIDLANNVHRK